MKAIHWDKDDAAAGPSGDGDPESRRDDDRWLISMVWFFLVTGALVLGVLAGALVLLASSQNLPLPGG